MQVDLSGKKALVTGGSGDIGRAICTRLAAAGCEIAFSYFSDHEAAEETTRVVTEAGGTAHALRANFADPKSLDGFGEEAIDALGGRCDIFVSNAASGVLRPALEIKPKHWTWTMDVNARALLAICQRLLDGDAPAMGSGGRVIGISSLGAVRAIPQYTAVGASKAALESVARHLSLDLGPRGITVNIVAPGIVDTRALQHFPNREQLLDVAAKRTPRGRLTEPDDVAGVVLFLCSSSADMIHGHTLTVDGGYAVLA